MPTFNIIKQIKPKKTFRVASIMGTFDLQSENIIEHFEGDITPPNDWRIGLIVGNSGTGKTTIAKELFPDSYINTFEYKAESILDDMPTECSTEDIYNVFSSVGFSSPPSWLKPYSVLSNGEKMRVDLARAILSNRNLFVFDEFTSVVDRNVAKIASFAMQRAIRKTDKKFIAISCHFDVEDWLLPDWVFDTNTMTFRLCEGQKKNRPKLKINIRKSKSWNETKFVWRAFHKYHYLTSDLNQNVTAYFMYVNDELCGFMAVMRFPHSIVKNYIKISRIVILPDYQGIGLSTILSETIGDEIIKSGNIMIGGTSNPSIIKHRKNSPKWKCFKYGRGGKSSKANSNYKSKVLTDKTGKNSKNQTINRISTSWIYIGGNTYENER